MTRILSISFFIALIASCSNQTTSNINHDNLIFSMIKSDFILSDINNYDCGTIDSAVITHILHTGIQVSDRDIHDYYSTTGCSVKGTLVLNSDKLEFFFDYGGILHIGDRLIIGCGETCCIDGFEYCSWEPNELSGTH